jgi:4-hydroxybenzoate polyprenyltransferase
MKIARFLKISRWIPWWPFLLGSYVVGAGRIEDFSLIFWVELFFMIPLAFYINGINDVYDAESDRVNPRKSGEGAEGVVLRDEEMSMVLRIAIFIAIIFFGVSIFSLNPTHIFLVFLALFLFFAYSHKLFRLREVPFIDSFVGGAVLCLFPALLAFSLKNPISELPLEIMWAVLPFMSFHAIAALEDVESDKKAGMNSIAIFLGEKKTKLFSACLIGLGLIFAILMHDLFLISVLGINFLLFVSLILLRNVDQPRLVLASFVTSWLITLVFYFLKANSYLIEELPNFNYLFQ